MADHSQCCFDCQYCKHGDSNCPIVLGKLNQAGDCEFCVERRYLEGQDESLQDISKLRRALKEISAACDGKCGEIAYKALKV